MSVMRLFGLHGKAALVVAAGELKEVTRKNLSVLCG